MAENVLEGLFTMVLDWHPAEVNNQVGYADVVLIQLVVTHLSMEVRRLGAGVERDSGNALLAL